MPQTCLASPVLPMAPLLNAVKCTAACVVCIGHIYRNEEGGVVHAAVICKAA